MSDTKSNTNRMVLGAITAVSTRKGDPVQNPNVPYIGLEHIERDLGVINGQGTASDVRSTKTLFETGDLLYGKLRPYLNKVWVAQFDGMCSTDILVYPKSSSVESSFLKYRFMTRDFVAYACENSNGVNLPRVSAKALARFLILLPPIPEQRRIVAEIEKQFTRLEAGVAALKRVQANLKRYRAAVLKAACEGRLVPTEAEIARKEGRAYESGTALLTRILSERRKNWQGRGKYKEPAAPETDSLGALPEGWAWGTLDFLAEIKGGITKDQKKKHNAPTRPVPYLRVANVQRGYLDLSEVKEIVATVEEINVLILKKGDILFNEGGDRDKLGRGWIWNNELAECIHQNHVFRARLFLADMISKFVSWYANTFGQRFFFDEGKHTTNLASISMTKLKQLPVPIPPSEEQTRIVAEVERRLSVIEGIEATVEANLKRAARLRQSVLQKAFSGGL